ncbi:hypothetical protein CEXT_199511 [Caerostris extrusa]|uniref:Uncharacterized protein n=1 Tax=Caerostris extrusa TaxID=172846 RepID=A0AAV4U956_CAEEX|nr:hypothetical protein CEXT_199511 [Caerostris extrusa]
MCCPTLKINHISPVLHMYTNLGERASCSVSSSDYGYVKQRQQHDVQYNVVLFTVWLPRVFLWMHYALRFLLGVIHSERYKSRLPLSPAVKWKWSSEILLFPD